MSTLAALVAALAVATTPTPTPSGPVVAPRETVAAATFPVEQLTLPTDQLVWSTASQDGAVTDQGNRDFTLNSDVLFAFDKADLTPRARTELTRIAGVLTGRTAGAGGQSAAVTRVVVTGYTDSTGADDYNLDLSRRRAEAVRAALAPALGAGVRVDAAGKGEADPIADNATKPGQALNRRVEIRGA